jgi:hypothetical protein
MPQPARVLRSGMGAVALAGPKVVFVATAVVRRAHLLAILGSSEDDPTETAATVVGLRSLDWQNEGGGEGEASETES